MDLKYLRFFFFPHLKLVGEMAPVGKMDLKNREALIKLLQQRKSQRNFEVKTFSCSQSTVPKISRMFHRAKSVKIASVLLNNINTSRSYFIKIFKNMMCKTSNGVNIEWKKASNDKASNRTLPTD